MTRESEESIPASEVREPAPMRSAVATVEIESARAIQEVQAAMAIAKRFPRDIVATQDRILQA